MQSALRKADVLLAAARAPLSFLIMLSPHARIGGMLDQLRQPMFKDVWNRIQDEANQHKSGAFAYENLRELLRAKTEEGTWDREVLKRADPLKRSAPLRTIRGLKGITGV
jgi:hypothetical protein